MNNTISPDSKHLISVIIPVYNVAPYLERCLKSVMSQTYANFEVILIDDGSTDSSATICDDYANNYPQIKVYHQQNSGVSSARNLGIEKALGNFLTFIDSDDVVETDMLKCMYDNAILHNVDISCCLIDVYDINGVHRIPQVEFCGAFEANDIKQMYFTNQFIKDQMYGPNHKLFSKAIIGSTRFSQFQLGEDILFIFELLQKAKSVYISNFFGYHYMHREGSAMTSDFSSKRLDYIYAGEKILELCKQEPSNVREKAMIWLFSQIIVTMRQIICNNQQLLYKSFIKEKTKFLKQNKMCFKYLNYRRKLDYWGIFYCPFYLKLVHFLKG